MDEKTFRIVMQIPESMVAFLDRIRERDGFKARARAIRYCIREEMKREAKTSSPSRNEDLQALL